jgi:hypothetical protein
VTRELVTRADLKGLDMAARWMLASGQPDDWQGPAQGIRGGIQLFVSAEGGRVVEVQLDVHDAGDLYQALEEHMENLAGDDVPTMTQEERDRALRKGRTAGVTRLDPDTHREEIRRRNLNAVREETSRPLLVKGNGEEYTGPRVIVPSDEYQDLLAAKVALEGILGVWTDPTTYPVDHTVARERVQMALPGLAAALDRLAELNP